MADKITDEDLVNELKAFGEKLSLPLKLGKRQILIKKLNHLRSKKKAQEKPAKVAKTNSRRSNLDIFSSDDSDIESAGQVDRQRSKIVTGVTKSLRRRSTANTPVSTPKSKLTRPTLRSTSRRTETETLSPSSPNNSRIKPSLYPDLNTLSNVNGPNKSFLSNDTFESSDSDLDASTYEVENKSVNTTFTIHSNNTSMNDGNVYSHSNTSYTNHQTPVSPQKTCSTNVNVAKYTNNKKKQLRLYPEHVSGGLLFIVGGFFLVLTVGYIFVRRDMIADWYNGIGNLSKPVPKSVYKLCTNGETKDCFKERVVERTMVVIRDLYGILSSKKGSVLCGTAEEWEKDMSVQQFKTYVKQLHSRDVDLEELVNSCLIHILLNPHWNIRAASLYGSESKSIEDIHHLESVVASMGLVCRFQRSIYRVTVGIISIAIACVFGFILLKYVKWRNVAKEKELHHVYNMVDEIIDILKRQHDMTQDESSQQQFLAVHHVRDQLLPPSKRRTLQPIWDKAVQFIEKNESRIRIEDQTIEGENFSVWRWIHNSPNGGKVWQGQAFGEHSDDNCPSPTMICPTPCLKIRNMFDADMEGEQDDWEVNIEDALLEKCRNLSSICHVFVDKDSKEGCVYVKCLSCDAAGRTRQALHGWWFDRRLVTVRYLKLDYYHSRFPESADKNMPLLPSTNQMSSLSQPYYRSSLEMT